MKGRVQLKDGLWYTVINYKGANGQYKRKWETTGLKERGNKKEASKILEERLVQFEQDEKLKKEKILQRGAKSAKQPLGTAETSFVDYCSAYIESIKNNLTISTYRIYKTYYLRVFKEYFKDKTIIEVTSDEIDGFNNYLRKERGVKNTTLKHYADVLRPALRIAFKDDKIIPDNPYDYVEKITREKPIVRFYNKKELDKLFEVMKGHPLELAFTTLIYYGLRRSELLGLRWKAIDFDNDSISVNHKAIMVGTDYLTDDKLKNTSSFRTLPLISHIKEMLLSHKIQIGKNKQFFGSAYINRWEEYIFVEEQGELYKPDNVSKSFKKLLLKHGLKRIRLHDLRHSCASLLLANGVNLKQIQEWLGHADFATTADIYSHLDFSGKMESANTLAKSFELPKKLSASESQPDLSPMEKMKKIMDAEMARLGIESASEYFKYLEQQEAFFVEERVEEPDEIDKDEEWNDCIRKKNDNYM